MRVTFCLLPILAPDSTPAPSSLHLKASLPDGFPGNHPQDTAPSTPNSTQLISAPSLVLGPTQPSLSLALLWSFIFSSHFWPCSEESCLWWRKPHLPHDCLTCLSFLQPGRRHPLARPPDRPFPGFPRLQHSFCRVFLSLCLMLPHPRLVTQPGLHDDFHGP